MKKKRGRSKYDKEAIFFLLPWLLGFLIFVIWPTIQSFGLSFTNYDIFTRAQFVGLSNYREMFTKDRLFAHSLWVTFRYVLLSVPAKVAFALFIAMILNKRLAGMGIYRTIYYLPSILGSSVAMSITWKMVFSHFGIINQLLGHLGLAPVGFLSNPDLALGTLSFISAWQFGSAMVIFLSALKNIPTELYEAAAVDGAKSRHLFLHITLPMLSPIILFNVIMNMIGSFQVFTQAYVMTSGGPVDSTYFYVLHLYRSAFEQFRMGYSSALAWVLTGIIVIATALTFKFSEKYVYYEN